MSRDLTDAWLAFFEALKIPVVISPIRYLLGTGGPAFMPDFELPTYHLHVKVTPREPDERLIGECMAFRWAVGAILLGVGLPGSPYNRLYCWDTTDSSGGIADHEHVQLTASDTQRLVFAIEDLPLERSYWCDPAMTHELPVLRHQGGWIRACADGHDFEVPVGVLRSRGHDVIMAAIAEARRAVT